VTPGPGSLVLSSEDDAGAAAATVRRWVDEHQAAASGLATHQAVNLFARDPRGEVQAGLLGYLWGRWLHVTHLWVAEPYRRQGLGRRLLEAAERQAAEQGAEGCFVSTFDFPAQAFCRRLGYEVYAELADYPPGHTTYHLRKWLSWR
jgi:ribosomal protein S18 acetylase RimI-like enzyme